MGKKARVLPKSPPILEEHAAVPMTPTILLKLMFHYFPPQIVREIDFKKFGLTGSELLTDDGQKIIEKIIASSRRLSRYGEADSVISQLKLFRRFPGADEYMEMMLTEPPGDLSSMEYHSLKDGRMFMSKQHIHSYLNWLLWYGWPKMPSLPRAVVSLFLRLREKQLSSTYEIVSITRDERLVWMNRLNRFMRYLANDIDEDRVPDDAKFKRSECDDFSKIYEYFQGFLYEFPDEDVEEPLKFALREYIKLNNPRIETKRFSEMYYITREMIREVMRVMDQSKRLFFKFDLEIKPEKPVVRVFNEGDMQLDSWTNIGKGQDHDFIMNAELMQAVQAEGEVHNLMIDTGFLQTVPFDEMLCTKFPHVEFVLDIVPPTFCRARPIKMRNGGYCVLAYPSFRQMYHEVVYGIRVYERLSGETLEEFEKDLVKIFLDYYNVELAKRDHPPAKHNQWLYRYFITETKEKELKKRVYALCRRYEIDETIKIPAPVIHVREKQLFMDFIQKYDSLKKFMETQSSIDAFRATESRPKKKK
ncbi:unnamed protein product [Caenorhabditis brenneri]